MKVSIIIPVYNSAPVIERCLCSVLKQSWQNLEIILVDLSLIHISEPTRLLSISYAVFCLKKKIKTKKETKQLAIHSVY